MFQTEIYKIISRKITLICGAMIFLFMAFQVHISIIGEEAVISEGRSYVRGAAIQKDKEIAAPYQGAMTMEKVNDIWTRYGKPVDHSMEDPHVDLEKGTADPGFEDNYCNRFVAGHFFDQDVSIEGEIIYTPIGEERAAVYLDPDLYFTYASGWSYYWDTFLTMFVLVGVLIIIGICPICSEEYALHTADVILTTQKGRGRLFGVKLGAALFFSGATYWCFMGAQFFMHAAAYGTEGLRCSTIFSNSFQFYRNISLGGTIGLMLLCGWLVQSALTVLVIAVSARNKQTFTSVLWSLLVFLMPAAIVVIVLSQLRRTLAVRLLSFFMYSLPSMLFPARFLEFSVKYRLAQAGVLAAVTAAAAVYAARRYCRHQV